MMRGWLFGHPLFCVNEFTLCRSPERLLKWDLFCNFTPYLAFREIRFLRENQMSDFLFK